MNFLDACKIIEEYREKEESSLIKGKLFIPESEFSFCVPGWKETFSATAKLYAACWLYWPSMHKEIFQRILSPLSRIGYVVPEDEAVILNEIFCSKQKGAELPTMLALSLVEASNKASEEAKRFLNELQAVCDTMLDYRFDVVSELIEEGISDDVVAELYAKRACKVSSAEFLPGDGMYLKPFEELAELLDHPETRPYYEEYEDVILDYCYLLIP